MTVGGILQLSGKIVVPSLTVAGHACDLMWLKNSDPGLASPARLTRIYFALLGTVKSPKYGPKQRSICFVTLCIKIYLLTKRRNLMKTLLKY